MPNNITATASNDAKDDSAIRYFTLELQATREEINLLSGRVELTMRLLARIVAKMDPGLLDDPHDPEVQRRSNLLGKTLIDKLRAEAMAQAAGDPEAFARLQRYFKDIP